MEHPPSPPTWPVFPLDGPTMHANTVAINYRPGLGDFSITLCDQRMTPIERPRETSVEAVFVLGHYTLSPRAIRKLADNLTVVMKAYEGAVGSPLLTESQFLAAGAMTLLNLPKYDTATRESRVDNREELDRNE